MIPIAPCPVCGPACRFSATSLPALAELADLGDALAQRHLVGAPAAGPLAPLLFGVLPPVPHRRIPAPSPSATASV